MKSLALCKKVLCAYCDGLLQMLEQSVRTWHCLAEEDKRQALTEQVRQYSHQLKLLEPFYRDQHNDKGAEQLHKICIVLTSGSCEVGSEEHIGLLANFYRLSAQIVSD